MSSMLTSSSLTSVTLLFRWIRWWWNYLIVCESVISEVCRCSQVNDTVAGSKPWNLIFMWHGGILFRSKFWNSRPTLLVYNWICVWIPIDKVLLGRESSSCWWFRGQNMPNKLHQPVLDMRIQKIPHLEVWMLIILALLQVHSLECRCRLHCPESLN